MTLFEPLLAHAQYLVLIIAINYRKNSLSMDKLLSSNITFFTMQNGKTAK